MRSTLRGAVAKTADTMERSTRLREACAARDWLQKDLIAATGIDRSTVSKHWNGTAIPIEKAQIYAAALGNIAPEDLAEVVSPSLLGTMRQIKTRIAAVEVLLGALVLRESAEDGRDLDEAEREAVETWKRLRQRAQGETPG